MTTPPYLQPFVLPTDPVEVVDAGGYDLTLPTAAAPVPAVVLVHGGPMREAPTVGPRQWPVFRGYAAALAARGVASAVVEHALLRSLDHAAAAAAVTDAAEDLRKRDGIDGDRIGVWYFSGGGPLAAALLRAAPGWLRVVALSYPMLRPLDGAPDFVPVEALRADLDVPIVLSRAGEDHAALLEQVDEFVAAARAAGADLTVVDVAEGHHSFDTADDTDAARAGIREALDVIATRLRPRPGGGE